LGMTKLKGNLGWCTVQLTGTDMCGGDSVMIAVMLCGEDVEFGVQGRNCSVFKG